MESSEENAASSSSDLEVVDGLKAHLNRIVSPFLPLLSTERIAALIDRAVDQNEASKESLFRFALTAEQSLLVVEISESENERPPLGWLSPALLAGTNRKCADGRQGRRKLGC
eukprot:scaffold2066_cov229-Ochromonas_danica.AAC.10